MADGGKLLSTSFRARVSEVGYPVCAPTESAKSGPSTAHGGTRREFTSHLQLRASVRCRGRVNRNPSTGQLRGPGCDRTGDGDGIVRDGVVRERPCLSAEARG